MGARGYPNLIIINLQQHDMCMVEENHLQNLKRNKTAPRMKALLSALLIVLSGVTAVVAQQTSLTNMEDSSLNSSENQRELQNDKTMKHKEPQEPISWPAWSKNSTEPTKNVRDTLRPIIVLVIVESQEPISWPQWAHPSADKMEKQAEAIIAESYTDSGRVTYFLIVINSVWTNGSASTIAESVCKGKYVPDGRNDGKVTFIDLGSESYTDSGRVTYTVFSLGGQEGQAIYVPDGRNDGKVSNDAQKEMVCNFKDGKSGSDLVTEMNGKFLDLKRDPIFRAKFAALMDEPVHDAPKLYMPHYTNWYASLGIASQHATYGLKLAESGMSEHVSHSNDTGNDENIDFPDIPPSLGGGNPTATIFILILNWDHDGDGYSLLDDLLNWVCDIFKGDEDGDDEDDGEGENDDSGSGGDGDGFKDPGNGNPPWGPLY